MKRKSAVRPEEEAVEKGVREECEAPMPTTTTMHVATTAPTASADCNEWRLQRLQQLQRLQTVVLATTITTANCSACNNCNANNNCNDFKLHCMQQLQQLCSSVLQATFLHQSLCFPYSFPSCKALYNVSNNYNFSLLLLWTDPDGATI